MLRSSTVGPVSSHQPKGMAQVVTAEYTEYVSNKIKMTLDITFNNLVYRLCTKELTNHSLLYPSSDKIVRQRVT